MRPRAIICSLMILPCAGLTSILKTLRSTTLRCSSGTFGRHFEGPRALSTLTGRPLLLGTRAYATLLLVP
jgi:hypothetical protein